MPPKYYCDYCDKQFHDTPASRKRHTQGSLHQRAKKLWFDSFKDPEDTKTGLCSYFMRTGTCQYGQNCKYLHPTPPGSGNPGTNFSDLNAYGHTVGPASASPAVVRFGSPADELGEALPTITESKLPPSLQPPPEGGYSYLPLVDWG